MDEPDLAPRASHLRRATRQDSASHGGDTPGFPELMAEVMASAVHFGHRQHIHLTWLAVRRYGTAAAVELVSDGIQTTARYAGVPQKYNATRQPGLGRTGGLPRCRAGPRRLRSLRRPSHGTARQAPAHPLLPAHDAGQHTGTNRMGRAGPRRLPLATLTADLSDLDT